MSVEFELLETVCVPFLVAFLFFLSATSAVLHPCNCLVLFPCVVCYAVSLSVIQFSMLTMLFYVYQRSMEEAVAAVRLFDDSADPVTLLNSVLDGEYFRPISNATLEY